MKNLLARIGTAIFAAGILITCVLLGRFSFLIFFFVLAMVSLHEFFSLSGSKGIKPSRVLGMICGGLLYIIVALYLLGQVHLIFYFFLIIPMYSIFINGVIRKQQNEFTNIAFTLTGILYTVLPVTLFASMAFLNKNHQYNHQPVLGFLFLLWSNDTGAFFAGKLWGKNRLLERISPKKTWEGFFGGAVAALITSFIISKCYLKLSMLQWAGMALLIIIFGTLGDLVESLYKRELDTKDSGSLLPGHGGVLDRFDGMFLSAPFVFLYLLLIANNL